MFLLFSPVNSCSLVDSLLFLAFSVAVFFFICVFMDSSLSVPQKPYCLPTFITISIRLDRSNFMFWRSQVLTTVRAHGFEKFLTCSYEDVPKICEDDAECNESDDAHLWHRKDQFLLSWILSSISESMLGYVSRCVHSFQAWKVFDDLFKSQSRGKAMNLRFQLQMLKKGNSSIDEYVLQFCSIADSLHAAGHGLNDEDLVMLLLGGLGPEYDAVVVNITTRAEMPSLTEVQSILHIHEMRLLQLSSNQQFMSSPGASSSTSTPSANVVSKEEKGQFGGNPKSKNKFYGKNRVYCQLCGKPNHTAIKCFKRFDQSFHGPKNAQSSSGNGAQVSSGNFQAQANVAHASSSTNPFSYHTSVPQSSTGSEWFVDSGATHHVASSLGQMHINSPYSGTSKLVVGNGTTASILHTGTIQVPSLQHSRSVILKDVLHVPDITKNLVSISKFLRDNDAVIEFHVDSCLVKDQKTNKILLRGALKDGLYQLDVGSLGKIRKPFSLVSTALTCNKVASSNKSLLWHMRLGHPCHATLCNVLKLLNPAISVDKHFCEACKLGKMHQQSFHSVPHFTTAPFALIHMDVWGPSSTVSTEGYK